MAIWNEADHPRDDEGKFTYKGGGTSKTSNEDKMQNRADILYPSMQDKTIKENYSNIGHGNYKNENLPIEEIFYPTMRTKKDAGEFTGGAGNLKDSQIEYDFPKYKRYIEHDIEQAPKWDSSYNAKFSDSEIQRARKFIQGEEKFEPEAYYPVEGDKLTIGYGHTGLVDGKPITNGMKITKEKAEELYRKDFETHTAGLKDVQTPLTSNQKIALASFMYNLGPNILKKHPDLLEKLNTGDIQGFADKIEDYNTYKGKVLKGLVNRRKREKELFLTPDGE